MLPRQICCGPFTNLTDNLFISLYFLNRPEGLPRMRGTASAQGKTLRSRPREHLASLCMLCRHKRFNNATREHLVVQEQNNTANQREPCAKNAYK